MSGARRSPERSRLSPSFPCYWQFYREMLENGPGRGLRTPFVTLGNLPLAGRISLRAEQGIDVGDQGACFAETGKPWAFSRDAKIHRVRRRTLLAASEA